MAQFMKECGRKGRHLDMVGSFFQMEMRTKENGSWIKRMEMVSITTTMVRNIQESGTVTSKMDMALKSGQMDQISKEVSRMD